ncbi:lysozyme inhibitor LprI family protein [Mucilaginibacter galii]|uniref:Lysozyme inhibitor LprI-like N-terminal domain-containing protein n=1 Tax=Mucilaginibacter galii TaxID=2005073 RepID=A0A917J887_9SPHI|nr:lysozyme inhibitor LprI family protein [Mucilaginibacter galii]GGI49710.1 hypothetical protein GCM10011425_09220 [Mucilaginibacter galii]
MKILLTALLFLFMLSAGGYAQSQGQMNADAYAGYTKADKQLNTVYQMILRQYAKDTKFIKNLKAAQRLWIQLRDADVAAKFPQEGSYGSVEPMCRAGYLEVYTLNRTKFLKVWLEGIPEGDVCNGSVKTR